MTHLQSIREKVIAANPHRKEPWEYDTGEPIGSGYIRENPVRLADIVLATIKKMDGKTRGEVKDVMIKFAYEWNCFDDSLDLQSPECLEFLAELLTDKG